MTEFIVIFVKSNSLQIYKYAVDEFKKIYGEDMVGEALAALKWNLDSVVNALCDEFEEMGKKIYVVRDEGFIEDDEEKVRPFLNKLIDRNVICVYILDTLNEEKIYSGSDLKFKISEYINSFKTMLNTLIKL